MASFIKKYKHGFIMLIYAVIYLLIFAYLEQRPVRVYHVIHTKLDDYIPFVEIFIIPYFLWFPYMIGTVIYFVFKVSDKNEYYRLAFNMIMGMSIFLAVSYFYPNIQHLRPETFSRDNIFIKMVQWLYQTDTPTNLLPSIHVFNSLAIHMAISTGKNFKDRRGIKRASLILTILIIMATMFLKQHSTVDVCLGLAMALFGYLVFYPEQAVSNTKFQITLISENSNDKAV